MGKKVRKPKADAGGLSDKPDYDTAEFVRTALRVRETLLGKVRIGRPPKRKPKEGERVALSLRMTPALKSRLDAAAEAGGRSQSQEAEFRLERSFDRTDLLSEVLTLAYGKELAGVLMMIGEVMAFAGYRNIEEGAKPLPTWAPDPFTYDQAASAAYQVLAALRPGGPRRLVNSVDGGFIGRTAIKAVRGDSVDADNPFKSAAPLVRSLLGPLVNRLSTGSPFDANPFGLALATMEAGTALWEYMKDKRSEPKSAQERTDREDAVVDIINCYLKNFIVPDWQQRRQSGEGDDSQTGEEKLASEVRHRA